MDLNLLSERLQKCPYPESLMHVQCGIEGWGFFPAARGYLEDLPPQGGIMLLGRDWGTKEQYDRWKGSPARDETASTSRNVRSIYENALKPARLWCTNYLPGIRKFGSAVGDLRSTIGHAEWNNFETFAWSFLQLQVLTQRPRIVVVFGNSNRRDLETQSRLGECKEEFTAARFGTKDEQHQALVTFAAHPHSLIRHEDRRRAAEKVVRIREVYYSGLQ